VETECVRPRTIKMRERICLYCGEPFVARADRAVLTCSSFCGQNIRRLREFDLHIRRTVEPESHPGFCLRERKHT